MIENHRLLLVSAIGLWQGEGATAGEGMAYTPMSSYRRHSGRLRPRSRQGQGPKYLSPLTVGRWVGWEQKQLVLETTNF